LIRKDLNLYLKKAFPPSGEAKIQKYLTQKPAKTIDLIGREEELNDIAHALEQSDRVLLVNGLGGVGKTELCKRYFWNHIDNYMHLAWVDVVGNIKESFVSAFNIKGIGFKEGDSMDERFEKIMDFLNCLDKHSLLVVDNIENPEDEDLDTIRALPFQVIANSRLNLEGFEIHTLDFLSPKKCKDLFYKHYRGKRDDTYVDKIVERCGRHTLSVELLARTAQNAALSIKSLYEKLETRGFNLNDVIGDKVHTFWRNEKEKKRFFNHLLKIFDLSDVTKGELHILTNLSVLPPIYIPIADFCEWMELKTKEDIHSLVFKGWLKQEGFNIFMHQVIQEVIRYKTSPDAKKCKNTIISLANKLFLKPVENPINKKEYVIFAETLMQHIEEDDKDLATLSNNLASIYKDLGQPEKALEFQLKALKIKEEVLDKNHPDLATSYNNLSLIYSDLGQPEKALEFQLKALKILEEVLDKNHPSLATSYNNLSGIYSDLGQPEKALEFQLKALKILEEVLDKNHPSLATSYNNLALIYKALGQPEKALEFQLKALKIKEEVLDKNHPSLATSYNNLAMIYKDLKDYKSAVQYGEKAVAILQKVFPEGHPDLDLYKSNLEFIRIL
jgi:tetratricopeptide (TPR) repeat protein